MTLELVPDDGRPSYEALIDMAETHAFCADASYYRAERAFFSGFRAAGGTNEQEARAALDAHLKGYYARQKGRGI